MVIWKDEYSVGVPFLDEQHKDLFVIANEIFAVLGNEFITDKYDQIVTIVDRLKEYTVEHFATEEAYMMENGYRKLLSHRVTHQDFVAKMNSIDFQAVDEDQDAHLTDILNFVTNWLVQHILQEDKLYAPQA